MRASWFTAARELIKGGKEICVGFLIEHLPGEDDTRYEIRNNCAHITIQETLAQYLALCILALASSSRFGRYHLSSVDHDTTTFRSVPVPRFLYTFFPPVDPQPIRLIIYSNPRSLLDARPLRTPNFRNKMFRA